MKRVWPYILLWVFLGWACDKETEPAPSISEDPVAVLLSSCVVSYTTKDALVALDFLVASGVTPKYYNADFSSVVFYNGSFTYTFISDTLMSCSENKSYSNFLLVDQSGTFDSIDEHNDRFRAFNAYYLQLGAGEYLSLGAYASGGLLEISPLTVYDGFQAGYQESVVEHMLDLAQKSGGYSCMYDAIYAAVEYVSANAPIGTQAITVFAKRPDEVSVHTSQEVVQFAKEKGVIINVIWFGDQEFDAEQMLELPYKTGGYATHCSYVSSLSSAFAVNRDFLRGEMEINRIRFNLHYWTGVYAPGFSFTHCFNPVSGVTDNMWFKFILN